MAVQFSAGNGWQGSPLKIADGKIFSTSIWFKTPSTLATQALYSWHTSGSANSHGLTMTSAGEFNIIARNAAETVILDCTSTTASLATDTWYNLLLYVNMNGLVTVRMVLNGTTLLISRNTTIDQNIDFTVDHFTLGAARDAADARTAEFLGAFDEIWWDTTGIDFTSAANIGLFIGDLGEKVGLGAQGRVPLDGAVPQYFFTHGPGNFGRNEGSEPDLSAVGSTTGTTGPAPAVETLSRGFKGEKWRESERSGIPFPESRLVYEPASGLEVADREWSTDRDEINRRARRRNDIFEY